MTPHVSLDFNDTPPGVPKAHVVQLHYPNDISGDTYEYEVPEGFINLNSNKQRR